MGWGVFHAKGSGSKVRSLFPPFEIQVARDIPGILPGCPGPLKRLKKLVQRKFVFILRPLSVAIRANRFARFARSDPGDSRESDIRVIRANRPIRAIKIEVSIANDPRESIRAESCCESPVPLIKCGP